VIDHVLRQSRVANGAGGRRWAFRMQSIQDAARTCFESVATVMDGGRFDRSC